MKLRTCLSCVAITLLSYAQGQAPQDPDPTVFEFGKVRPDAEIQHTFTFRNDGPSALQVDRVQLTPPLTVRRMTSRIDPGAEGSVTVQMEKPYPKGEFTGGVVVHFKGESRKPEEFLLTGQIVPPIEFIPFSAVFLSTQRGQPKAASVEIVNHEAEPIEISNPQCSTSRFTCELQTVEAGRRYELTVTLKGEGPGAEQIDTILLPTSSRDHRFLEVKAHTKIRDRVYSFPDSVNFETIDANYLKNRPQMVSFLTQAITVYQVGGSGLQVFPETDVPFLRLSTISTPEFRDRVEVRVTVDPTQLKAGTVKGSITIGTNDPEFPKLVIPVSGRIEGNW